MEKLSQSHYEILEAVDKSALRILDRIEGEQTFSVDVELFGVDSILVITGYAKSNPFRMHIKKDGRDVCTAAFWKARGVVRSKVQISAPYAYTDTNLAELIDQLNQPVVDTVQVRYDPRHIITLIQSSLKEIEIHLGLVDARVDDIALAISIYDAIIQSRVKAEDVARLREILERAEG